uniref:Uncharacterized protein n=1 Tax=Bicosoecida sp. CB-2014 TaxID=1486930 RepID=A0A7S1CCS0_9STRA|mmetsp:Transcript_19909/g.70431  ORF Transcript_19909/g.70431 Transcript_19909/m.70431 type:complete len:252 (+) Transcript_19909:291-1046(+)
MDAGAGLAVAITTGIVLLCLCVCVWQTCWLKVRTHNYVDAIMFDEDEAVSHFTFTGVACGLLSGLIAFIAIEWLAVEGGVLTEAAFLTLLIAGGILTCCASFWLCLAGWDWGSDNEDAGIAGLAFMVFSCMGATLVTTGAVLGTYFGLADAVRTASAGGGSGSGSGSGGAVGVDGDTVQLVIAIVFGSGVCLCVTAFYCAIGGEARQIGRGLGEAVREGPPELWEAVRPHDWVSACCRGRRDADAAALELI